MLVTNNNKQALYYGLSAIFLWSTSATAIKIALSLLDVFHHNFLIFHQKRNQYLNGLT